MAIQARRIGTRKKMPWKERGEAYAALGAW
jgi:hypothetical protein